MKLSQKPKDNPKRHSDCVKSSQDFTAAPFDKGEFVQIDPDN